MKNLTGTTVTIMVADMERAIQFYTDTLGLESIGNYGGHYAEIQSPGLKIGLHPADETVKKGNNLSIGFGTSDMVETLSELTAKGLEFDVVDDGWGPPGLLFRPGPEPLVSG